MARSTVRIPSRRRWTRGSLGLAALLACAGCKDDPAPPVADGDPTTGQETTDDDADGTGVDTTAGSTTDAIDPTAPTWHQDIAPIVIAKCGGCHADAGIAPFSVSDYEAAAPWAAILVEAVESNQMPPFAADETDECQMNHGWKDDLRLSDEQKQLLRDWADGGAPEGDPATAASIPEPPSVALTSAEQHLEIDASVAIGGTVDEFLCFSLDPALTEDAYLEALQINPGNDKIVHHVLIYVDNDGESADLAGPDGSFECSGGTLSGELVGAWAPGALPTRVPEGAGMLVPAGARLVMNVHYHPTGAGDEIDDSTSIDIDWTDERPVWRAELSLVGNGNGLLPGPNDEGGPEFRIPAGVSGHTETMLVPIPDDIPELRLWEIGSHMHYVGVDMLLGIERVNSPGPAEECLLHTPHYNFEWQRLYVYDNSLDDAIRVSGGDSLTLRCIYDNTLNNPGVVEALGQMGLNEPVEVLLGEETLDEMCLGVYGIAYPNFE